MSPGARPRRWRIGLILQLDLLLVAVVLAMGAVIGAAFVRIQAEAGRAALDGRIRVLGEDLASAAEVAWGRGGVGALDGLFARTVLDPDVAYVVVKDRRGEVVAARWAEETRGAVEERHFRVHEPPAAGDRTPEPFGAVHPEGRPVAGEVAVGVDLAPLAAQHRDLVARTAAGLVLAAGLAATLGHLVLTLLLRGPLARLVAGIRAVGAGDLGFRMRLEVRTAEVAEAARAFDDMAERLSAARAQVEVRNAELTRAAAEAERAREAIAEREERVRLLLESTAEAIYGVDPEGRCSFANPACARLLGYASPGDLAGRDVHALVHHPPGDAAAASGCGCALLDAVREGRAYHADEVVFWRADGAPVTVECWCHPVRRDGRLLGAVVTFLDVTEHRRLQAELLNMKKLESLGVLAGGIAHDFNNLLTGILGNVSVAREQLPDGIEARELLDEAEEAAKRARALTQQLLTFSNGGAPVKKVVSLRAVVEDAATFALRGTPVRGELSAAPGLWAVEADAGQLAQVIQNLVINAVQAMPRGGTLTVSSENAELPPGAGVPLPPGRYVRISVTDEGGGIAPEHLPKIFDPYFTTKRSGSGLGLATVYAIVKKHGGHVAVASRERAGTTFELWLPATGRPVEAGPAPAGTPVRGGGRVLVMDDEALVRSTAAGMLATLGYEVLTAADGAEAVRVYEAERRAGRPVAAVLMDLTVPGGLGGVEALEQLRALDPGVRAVATSGYSTDPVMSAHGRYGFVGVLPKPYTLDDMGRVMADAVAPTEAFPRGAAAAPERP